MSGTDQFSRGRSTNAAERLMRLLAQLVRRSFLAMERIAIGMILMLSLQLPGSAASFPDQPVSVSFYVIDESQHPLVAAKVEVLVQEHVVVTGDTDETGRVAPTPGQYKIRVTIEECII
jgi:hypothetical protein